MNFPINSGEEIHKTILPLLEMYEALPVREQADMFEEAINALLFTVVDAITTLRPSQSQQLIALAFDKSVDTEVIQEKWTELCIKFDRKYLAHTAYLTLFVLILTRVAEWVDEGKPPIGPDFMKMDNVTDMAMWQTLSKMKPSTFN